MGGSCKWPKFIGFARAAYAEEATRSFRRLKRLFTCSAGERLVLVKRSGRMMRIRMCSRLRKDYENCGIPGCVQVLPKRGAGLVG
jgi:hypothetical protein